MYDVKIGIKSEKIKNVPHLFLKRNIFYLKCEYTEIDNYYAKSYNKVNFKCFIAIIDKKDSVKNTDKSR